MPQAPRPSQIPDSVRTRDTIDTDSDAAARVDNEPLDPTLRGFFTFPGTSTMLRILGYVRGDLIHDFSPAGNKDEFVVSTIPIGIVDAADNTEVHARQTQFGLDIRRPVGAGVMRALFDIDFFGSGGARELNLRNAYAQVVNLLVGLTVSTLQDPDARPDVLDHEGPAARVAVRQAQFRYTVRLPRAQSVAFAVEQPKSDVPSTVDNETITPLAAWPDFVSRYRWSPRRGHLQAGVVLRSIGGFAGEGSLENQVFGWGALLSGSLLTHHRDTLVFELSGGRGFARYIKDMSGLGLDLSIDSQGRAQAAAVGAATAGYEHPWTARLRSTIAASLDQLGSLAGQSGTTYHSARYVAANLIFKSSALTTGVEYAYGRFDVHDGQSNAASRLQFSVRYDLVK